jgi:hypothetical protein
MPLAPRTGLILQILDPSGKSIPSGRDEKPPITISSCPTASMMRQARWGCRMAHHMRLHKKTLAKVKLTTNQTTPRTATQLTSAMTIIQYHGSCCPASTMKVSTIATVKLGSRSGFIKSIMRQSQFLSVFTSNLRSSRLCSWSGRSFSFRTSGRILTEVPVTDKVSKSFR